MKHVDGFSVGLTEFFKFEIDTFQFTENNEINIDRSISMHVT